MMRDNVKSAVYWRNFIELCDEIADLDKEDVDDVSRGFEVRAGSASSFRRNLYEKLSAAYSSGCDFNGAALIFRDVMRGLFIFLDVAKESPEYVIRERFFAYDDRTRYLALAILFDADRETVGKLVEAVDFWPGKDAIWEKMIAYLGVAGREPVDTIQWPEAYESLWRCFICPEGDRPALLKVFVDNWYKAMKKGGKAWVNTHKNKHDVYFGYWCFEAAGVAKMLGIDDSALKGHPHYPYDLVHPELEG